MADPLAPVASVIAVVSLTAKVLELCCNYSRRVAHARQEIQDVIDELGRIQTVLKGLNKLAHDPVSARFNLTVELASCLDEYGKRLAETKENLEQPTKSKKRNKVGLRDLKWPFESSTTKALVSDLRRYQEQFNLALNIDLANITSTISHKIDLSKLPEANMAAFDSYEEGEEAKCLPGTRSEIIHQIKQWADRPDGESIFWLNGIPGTGKSTLSRTICTKFQNKGRLLASFFFKRGGGDRANARKMFTTIAAQIARGDHALGYHIVSAVENEPNLPNKALGEQLEKLVLQPISKISDRINNRHVLVVDALDECEDEGKQEALVKLLYKLSKAGSKGLKVFLTSRPELPIRLGFEKTPKEDHKTVLLHEIDTQLIGRDLDLFLQDRFRDIRLRQKLDPSWPGKENLTKIVKLSSPLFIIASTICRFVGDDRRDAVSRLSLVLESETNGKFSPAGNIYLPVLRKLIDGSSEVEVKENRQVFHDIVGCITVTPEPFSIIDLSCILGKTPRELARFFANLHSVFRIPERHSEPIRFFHQSFRDFLLDPAPDARHDFSIDQNDANARILAGYIRTLSNPSILKENMANLADGTILGTDITQAAAQERVPREAQLASRNWVFHFLQGKSNDVEEECKKFLTTTLLPWIETMALCGQTSQVIRLIQSLNSCGKFPSWSAEKKLLQDAYRFVLINRQIIEQSPLQLYLSCLLFAPADSIVKSRFPCKASDWLVSQEALPATWDANLMTLEGGSNGINVYSVSVSLDGARVASGFQDGTVEIWDLATGETIQTLEGHNEEVESVSFSPDGARIASGSDDETVKIWDLATGETIHTLKGHNDLVTSVSFSPDGTKIASGSYDETVKIWDLATGETIQTLEGHNEEVVSVSFSPDGARIASGSDDETVKIWDLATGETIQTLEGHNQEVVSISFSPDGARIASGSYDGTVEILNLATGETIRTLKGHNGLVTSVSFSPDGTKITSGSYDKTVKIWDLTTGDIIYTLKGHNSLITSVLFSPDGTRIASGSYDETVKIWELDTGETIQTLKGHNQIAKPVSFSPDMDKLVSYSAGEIKVWDLASRGAQSLEENEKRVMSVSLSLNGAKFVSGYDNGMVKIWNLITNENLLLKGHHGSVISVSFSPDGNELASIAYDGRIKIWDLTMGGIQTLEVNDDLVRAVSFSGDGSKLASSSGRYINIWKRAEGEGFRLFKKVLIPIISKKVGSVSFSPDGGIVAAVYDLWAVMIWDLNTGRIQNLRERHETVKSAMFSSDGNMIATVCRDETVRIWDVATGRAIQTLKSPLLARHQFGYWQGVRDGDEETFTSLKPMISMRLLTPIEQIVTFSENWIWRGLDRALWLPPAWRPHATTVQEKMIGLGLKRGKVLVLRFD